MFEYPQFNENNEYTLCEIDGKNAEMRMNIKVKRFGAGADFALYSEDCETAFLILSGDADISWIGKTRNMKRANPFEKKLYCLHVPKKTAVSLKARAETEIIIQQTDNERTFEPVFYTPETALYQEFGKGQWGGSGHRICSTAFDYDNAPYSNMVLGEVFNQPGKWSSFPPHSHPQPEVYYFQFDKPQGFGACFIGDKVYKSTDGSAAFITGGSEHQQVSAPGYEMRYVWMIRHIDGKPWYKTTRIYAKEHEWLTKE